MTFFNRYALKAQAKGCIREAQIRLILQPVKDKLLSAFENQQNLEKHLSSLSVAPCRELLESDYASREFAEFAWQLHRDLYESAERTLYDRGFSNLSIRPYLASK